MIVTNALRQPGQTAAAAVIVTVQLVASLTGEAAGYAGGLEIIGPKTARTGSDGAWSLDLVPNSTITPAGTVYRVTEVVPGRPPVVVYITVPATGGPYRVDQILTTLPGALPPAGSLTQADLDQLVSALAAAGGAAMIGFTPTGTIAAAQVQAAIAEVAIDYAAAIAAWVATLAASGGAGLIGFSPTGTIASTTVQAAVAEIASEYAAAIAAAVAALVTDAPALINTLGELADAIADDPNFATTITTLIATKIPTAEKGVANGVGTLDATGKAPTTQQGAGTADATTFLRGDRAWVPVPPGLPSGIKDAGDYSALAEVVLDNADSLTTWGGAGFNALSLDTTHKTTGTSSVTRTLRTKAADVEVHRIVCTLAAGQAVGARSYVALDLRWTENPSFPASDATLGARSLSEVLDLRVADGPDLTGNVNSIRCPAVQMQMIRVLSDLVTVVEEDSFATVLVPVGALTTVRSVGIIVAREAPDALGGLVATNFRATFCLDNVRFPDESEIAQALFDAAPGVGNAALVPADLVEA